MLLHSVRFEDVTFLLLRLMVGLVFMTSGWNHLKDPEARSKSIEMSKNFTIFLGLAESLASIGLIFGVFTQFAALGSILIMLGAIQKKIFAWHIGFWGKDGYGWDYEVMIVLMDLVIFATNGGQLVLMAWRVFG
jgi:putative oxidoreductase